MKTDKRADHMHNCFRKLNTAGPSAAKYCFRCNVWFPTTDDFRKHSKGHLQQLDMYCGILRCRGLVASGGRCPFCLSDAQLNRWGDWHKMLHQFTTSKEFANHLMDHIRSYVPSPVITCPHPLCVTRSGSSAADLARHLYDDHGILQARSWTETTFRPSRTDGLSSPDKIEAFVQGNIESQEHLTLPETGQLWGAQVDSMSRTACDHIIPQHGIPNSLDHTHGGLQLLHNDGMFEHEGLAQIHPEPKRLSKRLLRQGKIRLSRQKRRARIG